MNLDYLLIYQADGIPVYSRCFGHFCNSLMRDDILFSAFLSALSIYADAGGDSDFTSIDFEGQDLNINLSLDGLISTLDIGKTRLIFFKEQKKDLFYVAGFPLKKFDLEFKRDYINNLFDDLEVFFDNEYTNIDWSSLVGAEFEEFEENLLQKVIYPWMKENKSPHSCMMGENCPMRVALTGELNEKTTIWKAMNDAFTAYKKMSIFKLMRMMFAGIRHKMRSLSSIAVPA
ncbi:MAG: hypothetical protein INQ03_23050 [Candidatus Heimdallarchaeota archaeon]|nr:hypothetical protein [Candidatus Heimdallarchaeota archaeon]